MRARILIITGALLLIAACLSDAATNLKRQATDSLGVIRPEDTQYAFYPRHQHQHPYQQQQEQQRPLPNSSPYNNYDFRQAYYTQQGLPPPPPPPPSYGSLRSPEYAAAGGISEANNFDRFYYRSSDTNYYKNNNDSSSQRAIGIDEGRQPSRERFNYPSGQLPHLGRANYAQSDFNELPPPPIPPLPWAPPTDLAGPRFPINPAPYYSLYRSGHQPHDMPFLDGLYNRPSPPLPLGYATTGRSGQPDRYNNANNNNDYHSHFDTLFERYLRRYPQRLPAKFE